VSGVDEFARRYRVVDRRLGCPDSTVPESKPTPHVGASRSMFVAHEVTNQGHPRFRYCRNRADLNSIILSFSVALCHVILTLIVRNI